MSPGSWPWMTLLSYIRRLLRRALALLCDTGCIWSSQALMADVLDIAIAFLDFQLGILLMWASNHARHQTFSRPVLIQSGLCPGASLWLRSGMVGVKTEAARVLPLASPAWWHTSWRRHKKASTYSFNKYLLSLSVTFSLLTWSSLRKERGCFWLTVFIFIF